VQIAISDNGPGIPTEIRRHLFDPFYSGREAGRGIGLGLSKCWQIARLHGGDVEVDGPPTGGARFLVTLPIASPRSTA
jgi:signal transduction histidine kinase